MALVRHVADRAVFWAELGAVSAPVLLGRVSRLLEDASAEDLELRAALRLAAGHVEQKCLVWPAGAGAGGGESDADEDRDASDAEGVDRSRSHALDVWSPSLKAPWKVRDAPSVGARSSRRASGARGRGDTGDDHLLEDKGDMYNVVLSDRSDTEETSVSAPAKLRRGLARLLPLQVPPCCLGILPGVGTRIAHIIWLTAFALAVPAILWHSGKKGFNDPFDVRGLSDNVGPMIDNVLALKFSMFIPMLATTRSLVCDVTFDAALNADLDSPRGPETKNFMWKSVLVALVNTALSGWIEFHRFNFTRDLYSKLALVRLVVVLSVGVVFLALYKVSVNQIMDLQERIANPEMTPKFWRDATKSYLAIARRIDLLWRQSGFSSAVSIVLAFNLLNSAVFSAMGIASVLESGTVTTWRPFAWAFNQLIVVLIGLYFMADIYSRCSSKRSAKHSVLFLARQHFGSVPDHCWKEHWAFVQCVEAVPCGVEVAILLVITFSFVAPVVRIAFACTPIVAGVVFKVALSNSTAF